MEDAAGWRADPTGRHQERYFRSTGVPTTRVRNNGIESADEGLPGRDGASRLTPGLAEATALAPIPSSDIPSRSTHHTGSTHILVASYRAPMVDEASVLSTQADKEVAASHPPKVVLPRHKWSLIAAAGVLAVLLVAASAIAVEQHNVANKWMSYYHAEVNVYHAEVHKDAGLYASLVSTQQRMVTCANDTKSVLSDIHTYFHDGYVPSSSESDATTARQACQTATQGTSS